MAVKISFEQLREAMEDGDESCGFCTECGEQAYGVEPDARKYKCESCGANAVYGAEELMLCGAIG